MTTHNLTEFKCSHLMELAVLVQALSYRISKLGRDTDGGITHTLWVRANTALVNADAADRANQLRGGRAAND